MEEKIINPPDVISRSKRSLKLNDNSSEEMKGA
jgi:hypothetical protein